MSHTFKLENYIFISDSDINEKNSTVLIKRELPEKELEVPGRWLLKFIADYVARKRISNLEDMNFEQILGIK
jgi:hypothetical protein